MIHIFIINPCAGLRDRSEGIRQFLEKKTDFSYLVFDTEKAGDEAELVKKMLKLFEDEKVRFYICGGSGTFAKAMWGVPEKDFSRVEFAHYPCGLTNDFIKNFGKNQKFFYNMDNLIRGEVIQVDYVHHVTPDTEQSNSHVLFSTMGLTEIVERFAHKIRFLGGMNTGFLYVFSFIVTFLFNPTIDYSLEIDGEDYSGEYDMVYMGNSICMGGSFYPISDSTPDDGQMEVMLLKKIRKLQGIKFMSLFRHGKMDEVDKKEIVIRKAASIAIKRRDGKKMYLNVDGELVTKTEWRVELKPAMLNYVVPHGVTVGQWV